MRLSEKNLIYDDYFTEENWNKLAGLEFFAGDHGHTISGLAIAWLLSKLYVSIIETILLLS